MKLLLKKISILHVLVLLLTHQSLADTEPWEKVMMADLLKFVNQATTEETPISYFYKGDNPRNAIYKPQTSTQIDAELRVLDNAGKRTLMYVGYCWLEYTLKPGEEAGVEVQKTFRKIQSVKVDKIYRYLQDQNQNTDNLNLHINLMTYVKIHRADVLKDNKTLHDQELFVDFFYPRSDMSHDCKKAIVSELNKTIQTKGEGAVSLDPNRAMLWRAKLLKEKLIACPTVPATTGDQSKDLLAMLNYIKAKAASKEKILLRTAPTTPATLAGENIKLDKTTYTKLQFAHSVATNPSFSKPEDYQLVYSKDDKTKATFQFFDKNQTDKVLFTLTLTDKEAESKKDSLEKWLMGRKQLITLELLECIFPNGDDEFKKESLPHLNKYMNYFQINTTNRIAHFLAQIGVEIGAFKDKGYLKEDLNYSSCNIRFNLCKKCYSFKTDDKAKCPTEEGDCKKNYTGKRQEMCDDPDEYANDDEAIALAAYDGYMGRGFIHLTWKENYEKIYLYCFQKGINPLNFKDEPKLLSDNVEMAAMSACAFFEKNGCNQQADLDNFNGVMNKVNASDTNKDKKLTLLAKVKDKLKSCK